MSEGTKMEPTAVPVGVWLGRDTRERGVSERDRVRRAVGVELVLYVAYCRRVRCQ